MSKQYYDTHTIWFRTKLLTESQIREEFDRAITEGQKYLSEEYGFPVHLDIKYRINIIRAKEDGLRVYGFVYLRSAPPGQLELDDPLGIGLPASTIVYNMLTGKEPDGTDRVEYRRGDSTSLCSEEICKGPFTRVMANDPVTPPPLMDLRPVSITPAQQEEWVRHYREVSEADAKDAGSLRESSWASPKGGPEGVPQGSPSTPDDSKTSDEIPPSEVLIEINAAFVDSLPDYHTNQLMCDRVPREISPDEMIRRFFAGYSSKLDYPKIVYAQTPSNKYQQYYRLIIAYDPATQDGAFALHMTKRISVRLRDGSEARLRVDHVPKTFVLPTGVDPRVEESERGGCRDFIPRRR